MTNMAFHVNTRVFIVVIRVDMFSRNHYCVRVCVCERQVISMQFHYVKNKGIAISSGLNHDERVWIVADTFLGCSFYVFKRIRMKLCHLLVQPILSWAKEIWGGQDRAIMQ